MSGLDGLFDLGGGRLRGVGDHQAGARVGDLHVLLGGRLAPLAVDADLKGLHFVDDLCHFGPLVALSRLLRAAGRSLINRMINLNSLAGRLFL